MVPHREDFRLCFYIYSFLRPPLFDPPDPLAVLPDPLDGLLTLRPSYSPLDHQSGLPDPPADLFILQLAYLTLWLPFWAAALKGLMTYGTKQGKFQSRFLCFFVSSFLRFFVFHSPQA